SPTSSAATWTSRCRRRRGTAFGSRAVDPRKDLTMKSPDPVRLGRRTLLGAAGAAGAAVTLAACGGSKGPGQTGAPASGKGGVVGYAGSDVQLQDWNGLTGGDGPVMKKLVQKFMDANPKVKVTTTSIAWADLFQKLPAAVQSGKAPDICLMHTAD